MCRPGRGGGFHAPKMYHHELLRIIAAHQHAARPHALNSQARRGATLWRDDWRFAAAAALSKLRAREARAATDGVGAHTQPPKTSCPPPTTHPPTGTTVLIDNASEPSARAACDANSKPFSVPDRSRTTALEQLRLDSCTHLIAPGQLRPRKNARVRCRKHDQPAASIDCDAFPVDPDGVERAGRVKALETVSTEAIALRLPS